MKKLMLFILVTCLMASIAQGAVVWSDDFNTDPLDTAKWSPVAGGGGGVGSVTQASGVVTLTGGGAGWDGTMLRSVQSFARSATTVIEAKVDPNESGWWTFGLAGDGAVGPGGGGSVDFPIGFQGFGGGTLYSQDFGASASPGATTVLYLKLTLGATSGALYEYSLDGSAWTTLSDTRGSGDAGTEYQILAETNGTTSISFDDISVSDA